MGTQIISNGSRSSMVPSCSPARNATASPASSISGRYGFAASARFSPSRCTAAMVTHGPWSKGCSMKRRMKALRWACSSRPWMRRQCDRNGFEKVPLTRSNSASRSRHGTALHDALRGGEAQAAAIVAMGQVRAAPFRFHLIATPTSYRSADYEETIARGPRFAGGLPSAVFHRGGRHHGCGVVVLHVVGRTWTIAECGDRDPGGARVGAILQALIAASLSSAAPPFVDVCPLASCLHESPSY